MKLLSFILALALAQGALSACSADNCARAVTGTRTGKMPDVTSRMRDCSSFMLITVTPATSTITATATVTTTTTLVGMMKRQAAVLEQRQVTVTPSSVPTYASACSGTARYSSACSCWGITAGTTTASTPVTRTTVTVTATVSVCPVGDTKCGTSCFNLQVDPRNCGACDNACAAGSACQSGACAPIPRIYTCPPQDTAGFHVGSEDTSSDPIFCSYPAVAGESPNDFFCTYSHTTGVLVTDNDAGLCPTQATTT